MEALEYLDSPEGIGYIDYRYISENEVDDPDEQYPDRLTRFSKLKQELERA